MATTAGNPEPGSHTHSSLCLHFEEVIFLPQARPALVAFHSMEPPPPPQDVAGMWELDPALAGRDGTVLCLGTGADRRKHMDHGFSVTY